MYKLIPAKERFYVDHGWLKTYHLFSFDQYNDPSNQAFFSLRVFNDDTIDANGGFPMHPHSNFEILTIVLEGALTHADNAGNQETIAAGRAQRMSAGTGIVHSEFNMGSKPCHLFQIWFAPRTRGAPPSYQTVPAQFKRNALVAMASGKQSISPRRKKMSAAKLNSDAEVFLLELSQQKTIALPFERFFIYVLKGTVSFNDEKLERGDQVRADSAPGSKLRGTSREPARLIVMNLARH